VILESIITSVDKIGNVHATPFGIRMEGEYVVISPYKPSTTLDNILVTKHAVLNLTDDVRVFAGALTSHKTWTYVETSKIKGFRLVECLTHMELKLVEIREDAIRPQLVMEKVFEAQHGFFKGFNRAQAAVIELAVLVSRIHMLPRERIETELAYLQIAIDKTAGAHELEAWGWLIEKIEGYYKENAASN
jgi:uncharacterized protein